MAAFTLTGQARKPRKDGQATRTAIFRAARELFTEFGYKRTTVRAIAERAGCNPALITRYFGGKAELLGVVLVGGTHDNADDGALLDTPFRCLGSTLVRRHVQRTAALSRAELHDHVLMLLRSTSTDEGSRALSDPLARMDVLRLPHHQTDPDAALRTALIHVQLVGLTLLRDIARLPELRAADAETLGRHLGPIVQFLLEPGSGASKTGSRRAATERHQPT